MPEDDLLAQYQEKISQSFKDGEYELCLVFTDKALKLDKDNFNALCYKATCLEKLGSYKKSLKIINQCLQEHDDFFPLWVTRGDCYYGLEKWKEAFDSYFTALPLDADNGAIMDKCARSLFRLGDINYALHFIQQATNKAESPVPFIIMAVMLKRMGLTEYSQHIARKGKDLFPDEKGLDDWLD